MGSIKGGFDEVYRDYRTAGVPASGPNEPVKSEIRGLGATIEQAVALAAVGTATTVVKPTRADLNADLSAAAGTVAFVYADPNPLYNDFYFKDGGPGVGAWAPTTAFNDVTAAIVARNGGRYVYGLRALDSAPDAIKVVTEGGVPTPAYTRWDIYSTDISDANVTVAPTLNVNGLGAKVLRGPAGNELLAGDLQPGMQIFARYVPGADEFRIVLKSLLPGTAVAPSTLVTFTPADPTQGNIFVGTVSPDPATDIFSVVFQHKITAVHVGGGVLYDIPEVTGGDSRQLKTVEGLQISPGTWKPGDTILFRYVEAGYYELIAVLSVANGDEPDSGNTLTQYYARANSNIYALRSFGK